MARHHIILNPIDSMVQLSGSGTIRTRIFSSTDYCRDALSGMSLAPCAKDILSFLRTNARSFKTILVTAYDPAIVRIIANHFNIPYEKIIGSNTSKSISYESVLSRMAVCPEDTVVLSSYVSDLHAAELSGIKALYLGRTPRGKWNWVRNVDDLIRHLGLRLVGVGQNLPSRIGTTITSRTK